MGKPSRRDWKDRPFLPGGRITKTDEGCWLYGSSQGGYPAINGKPVHRIVYDATKGIRDEYNHIHHWCMVKNCVNPDHLFELSPSEHRLVHESHNTAIHYIEGATLPPSLVRQMSMVISPAEREARRLRSEERRAPARSRNDRHIAESIKSFGYPDDEALAQLDDIRATSSILGALFPSFT